MYGNDLNTIIGQDYYKIISYEAMKFVRNVLVLHRWEEILETDV